jgi:hypothetical protein
MSGLVCPVLTFKLISIGRQPVLLQGRPRSVTSQASELLKRKIGITPFDCPRDNCCQALLLDPDATIRIGLHKRLFLLVSGRGE